MSALYALYETHGALMAPGRLASAMATATLDLAPELRNIRAMRRFGAFSDVIGGAQLTHTRPAFDIDSVDVNGTVVPVTETVSLRTPFASLAHFEKALGPRQPPVLLIAPMSGHFATLVAPTIRSLLEHHDVYVTDWHNARDVPTVHGRFGMNEYVEHLIDFLRHMGPGVHIVAVCQPCVPAVMATSILAEDDDPCQPSTLTLMAGPIDARINPTQVNVAATQRSLEWYRRRCIDAVPRHYAGAGRRVYPGFMQAGAFISMNPQRHVDSHRGIYRSLSAGDVAEAATAQAFYREYFAVMDMDAEFYLDNVSAVFQDYLLAKGQMTFRGRPVRPSAVTRTALLTVEGERDDICAPGQTRAASRLFTGLRPDQREHHLQPGAGHYGVFSGKRWRAETYPVVRNFIRTHNNALATS